MMKMQGCTVVWPIMRKHTQSRLPVLLCSDGKAGICLNIVFFTLLFAFLSFSACRDRFPRSLVGIIANRAEKGCFEYDKKRIARVSDFSCPRSSFRSLN